MVGDFETWPNADSVGVDLGGVAGLGAVGPRDSGLAGALRTSELAGSEAAGSLGAAAGLGPESL